MRLVGSYFLTICLILGGVLILGAVTNELARVRPSFAEALAAASARPAALSWPNCPFPVSDAPAGLQALLTAIAVENLPHQYEDTKHWGQTKEVFDGLKIHREGLRIKTKRRTKQVKHGTWQRYRLTLVDPSKNLLLRVDDLHDAGQGKVGFQMTVAAKVRAEGRLSEWRRGVQLVSLSAEGEGQVELRIEFELGMVLDPSNLPPDVILKPEVTDADLIVPSFRVVRISKVEGPLADELGRGLCAVLMHALDDKKEKLIPRVNQQIAKHEDQLRFSAHDLVVKKWLGFAGNSDSGGREPTARQKKKVAKIVPNVGRDGHFACA